MEVIYDFKFQLIVYTLHLDVMLRYETKNFLLFHIEASP